MARLISGLWSVILAVLLAASLAGAATAADCPGGQVVEAAARSFQAAARSGSPKAFSSALARHAPVHSIALQALGPYRAKLPAARKSEFLRNALGFMGRFVAKHSDGLRGTDLTITACRGSIIESTANGRKVVWRLSGRSILDVKISGFSLSGQMRTKFQKVITRHNGDVGRLIDWLEGGV